MNLNVGKSGSAEDSTSSFPASWLLIVGGCDRWGWICGLKTGVEPSNLLGNTNPRYWDTKYEANDIHIFPTKCKI